MSSVSLWGSPLASSAKPGPPRLAGREPQRHAEPIYPRLLLARRVHWDIVLPNHLKSYLIIRKYLDIAIAEE